MKAGTRTYWKNFAGARQRANPLSVIRLLWTGFVVAATVVFVILPGDLVNSRGLLIAVNIANVTVFIMIAVHRAAKNTPAQGLIRVGFVLLLLAVIVGTLGGLLGWPPEVRVSPQIVAAVILGTGLFWDAAQIVETRPDRGPFKPFARVLLRNDAKHIPQPRD